MENLSYSQLDSESATHTPIQPEDQDNLFEEIPLKGSKKAYRCTFPECGKLFNFKSETARHTLIHKDGRPHTCPHQDCNKTFKRIDALKNHLQLHEKVLPHLCDVPGCGKRFATKAAIRYHKIKHDNQRVYKCEFPGCEKSFLTPSQLKQHQNASNVHYKKSALVRESQEQPEAEPRKEVPITKVRVSETKDLDQEFTELAPKFIEIMQWETKTQRPEMEISQTAKKAEIFDALYTYLIKENKILKEKMQERQNITDICAKKHGFVFESDNPAFDLLPQDFNMILNGDETKFIEFLRGQENGGH